MLFTSFQFILFFPAVLLLYWSVPHKFRWVLLLLASYFFYLSFNIYYGVLILVSSLVSYYCGVLIAQSESMGRKRLSLMISVVANLLLLFYFKYFNFAASLLNSLLESMQFEAAIPIFEILLPIGISFYTFQVLSYNLDIFYGLTKPEKNFGIYAVYVSFFPQLVAGPIERSTTFLPQFHTRKTFRYEDFSRGIKLIIWGFFKKLVIADRISVLVNQVYDDVGAYHGVGTGLAIVLFALQIYCDFSAYSDIAIGCAKMMGFDLMKNFNRPYTSKSLGEFWRRWHISLYSWFTDYLYTPVVFKRRSWGKTGIMYAVILTFTLSGVWHGAKLTFFFWGLLLSLGMVYELVTAKWRRKLTMKFNTFWYGKFTMMLTFGFIVMVDVLFRSENMEQVGEVFTQLFSFNYNGFSGVIGELKTLINGKMLVSILLLGLFLLIEPKIEQYVEQPSTGNKRRLQRQLIFASLIALVLICGKFGEDNFIYFQF